MEDFNLHLTGDVHAIGAAHNLAAAFLDNHLHHGNALGIDPHAILWPRVVDISDRAAATGGDRPRRPRERRAARDRVATSPSPPRSWRSSRWRPTCTTCAPASAGSCSATTTDGHAGHLRGPQASPASMTVLLVDAIKPNLLQTLEGGPAFVHCGPFANIAHGNNSIIADRLALATNEIVCTEAGFGADMGAEKFFDIKCRASGLRPDAAVVVATIRALKMHGGVGRIVAGKPLDPALLEENVEAVRRGGAEPRQADRERPPVRRPGRSWRSTPSRPTPRPRSRRSRRSHWRPAPATRSSRRTSPTAARCDGAGRGRLGRRRGGRARLPAPLPRRARRSTRRSRRSPTRVYGADGVDVLPAARKALTQYEELGFGSLPVCMAKTQYSLSHDADAEGPTERLPRPDPRGPPVRRCRVHHAARRRDADDARAAVASGRREDRHRRRRERRRAVLGRRSRAAPAGGLGG